MIYHWLPITGTVERFTYQRLFGDELHNDIRLDLNKQEAHRGRQ